MKDCKRERRLSDPLDPPSEETMKWACDVLESHLKTMRELNRKSKLPIEVTEEHIKIINRFMEEKKTKKMTKAEAFEWLKGKKVYCYDGTNTLYCKLVKKLLACGCDYKGFMCPHNYSVSALAIDREGRVGHVPTEVFERYINLPFEAISADDILSIEIVEEKEETENINIELEKWIGVVRKKFCCNGWSFVISASNFALIKGDLIEERIPNK